MKNGVLYVATGEDLISEARKSAESVRLHMNNTPIGIVTDESQEPTGFDTVVYIDNPEHGFKDKIQGMLQSPYERTVYLDTDTYVAEAINELFDMLDRFDIAATHNPNRNLHTNINLGVPQSFPEYNTGVVAFKKQPTTELFNQWQKLYKTDHRGDQPSFRRVLYDSNLRLATLPREYNYLPRYPEHIVKDVKIFHGRLIDIDTQGASIGSEIRKIVSDVNVGDGHRLYYSGGVPVSFFIPRVKRSIRQRGILGSIQRVLNKYK